MNKKLFIRLCKNFDKEPDKDLYELWDEELEDIDNYYIELAVKKIIKTYSYFPILKKIMEELNTIDVYLPIEEKTKRMIEKNIIPEWLNKEIINEEITNEEDFKDFQNFIQEFKS